MAVQANSARVDAEAKDKVFIIMSERMPLKPGNNPSCNAGRAKIDIAVKKDGNLGISEKNL